MLLLLLLCCCICLQRNKGDTYPVDEKERANGNDPEKELADTGYHDYQRPYVVFSSYSLMCMRGVCVCVCVCVRANGSRDYHFILCTEYFLILLDFNNS